MSLTENIKNIQDFFTETWKEVERLRQEGATLEEIALYKISRAKMTIIPISRIHSARKDPLSPRDTHCSLITLGVREGEIDYEIPADKRVKEEHLIAPYQEFFEHLRQIKLNPKLKVEQDGQIVKITIASSSGINYNEAG